MTRVPAYPQRDPFFDAKGDITPQTKAVLRSLGISDSFFQQVRSSMALFSLAFPPLKWFQTVGLNVNQANDLALLGASIDENARGGEVQRAAFDALLALVEPTDRAQLAEQLQALALERSERGSEDQQARLLAATAEQTPPPSADPLLAASQVDPAPRGDPDAALLAASLITDPRTDFRAFVLEDTHAKRVNGNDYPAAAFRIGQLFWETDRTLLYAVVLDSTGAPQWFYVAGQFNCLQAAIPADFGANDDGALVGVTDYVHVLKWKGGVTLAYDFAPGDPGGAFIQGFEETPSNVTAWVACAGQAAGSVHFLKKDGTLGTNANALPAAAAGYVKFAAAYNAARAAVAWTAAASAVTGNTATENAHTHPITQSAFGTTKFTTSGSGTAAYTSGGIVTTPSGAGSAHSHGAGTLQASAQVITSGELAGVDLIPYFRV